jgi:hypothetical protein
MKHQPPPDDPAWEHIRARYEAGEEKVKAIADEIGMNLQQLSTKAKRHIAKRSASWSLYPFTPPSNAPLLM